MNQHKYQCAFRVPSMRKNDQNNAAKDDNCLSQTPGTLQISKSDDAL
jgi:hypothetical protein